MNTQSKYSTFRNFRNVIFSVFLLTAANTIQAQSVSKDSIDKNASVKYLGSIDDMLLIGVKYDNAEGKKFNLSIYNSDGDILFRDTYADKQFDKKFKIPKEHGTVNFVFGDSKYRSRRNFEVANTSTIVEDVVVRKIN